MSDEAIDRLRDEGLLEDVIVDPTAEARMAKAITEADQRARKLLANSPKCQVCGGLITTRGRSATHHYSCEPKAPTAPEPGTLGSG